MACEMSGGCELQDLGYRYGLDHWTYPTYTQRFPVDATPPHHLLDHNRCVLCRRCLRACAELVANHTLDLRQRGANTMLTADMDVPLGQSSCINCGTCVNVCPTGALIDKRSAFMARPAEVERVATVCSQCSLGCGLNVVMHRGHVLRLESLWEAPVNGGLLCRTGRFEALADGRPRLLKPMLKEKGRHVPVSWEAALAAASQRLGATAPERLGVFTTTRLTNEALGLLHAIFVKHLKAAHHGASHGAAPGMPAGRCGKLADIAESDLILLAGSDPARDQPVASFLIKRALDRGARLVTVESHPTELTAFAEAIFPPRQISPAVAMAEAAEKPVVIYGAGLTPKEATALSTLDAKAVFIPLHPGVNTLTAETLALNGEMDAAACDTLFIAAGDENGTLEAITQKAGPKAFVIVQACYGSTLADRADLLLPMATWLERSGTFTNTEGTLQRAHAALTPSGQSRPDWDILGRLAERLGLDAAIAKDAVRACRV